MTARRTTTSTDQVELQLGDGASPETFSKIAAVRNPQGPDGQRSEIDATTLDSGQAMEYLAGMIDQGSVSFEAVWDEKETTHGSLRTLHGNGNTNNFKFVLPDGSPNSEIAFSGFAQQITPSYQVNDIIRANVTIRVTGAVTITTS